jgi:4-amino-4-deoxy-L-arabinose transferase-like glycosyltransferase
MSRLLRRWLYPLACVAVGLVAFWLNWVAGHKGVFLLDQSMVFDGGWRILNGQRMYRDFLAPFGPVTFWIQATSFYLWGVNWSATVLPACVLNLLASWSVMRMVRIATDSRGAAIAGGLITATCFQAPFGTLWFEQVAMFFGLLALQAGLEALRAQGLLQAGWAAASGACIVLAIASKQNFGILMAPIAVVMLWAGALPERRRAAAGLLAQGVGMALTAGLFGLWLAPVWGSFQEAVVEMSREISRERISPSVIIAGLTFNHLGLASQFDLVGCAAGAVVLLMAFWNRSHEMWGAVAPAAVLAVALPVFRSLTQVITLNNAANNYTFTGLAVTLGCGAAARLQRYLRLVISPLSDPQVRAPSSTTLGRLLLGGVGLWGVAFVSHQSMVSLQRIVHSFPRTARFERTVQSAGLEGLRWGDPTIIRTSVLDKSDFEGVLEYLRSRKTPFFVMGDSSLLYALAGMPSPQPLLYFLPSHSFVPRQIPELDAQIHAALVRNHVQIVVREKDTFLPAVRESYPLFPKTWAWFQANFTHRRDFGIYEIWEIQAP